MPTEQYHEPPDELPQDVRTFARMCTSLIEEAEAIGWYAQRLALERDSAAAAIMRDAQNEEFKHFSMDLEYLLRRTPRWRTVAERILFQPGDILEHGEAGEEAVDAGNDDESDPPVAPGRAPRPRPDRRHGLAGLARHRRTERTGPMNHLLRELAPITDAGWEELEEEARTHLPVHLAARKLVDFSGPHGWDRSATNLGRTEPLSPAPVPDVDARRRRVLPLVETRAWFSLARAELELADKGADDIDLDPLDEAARRIALAENTAVFSGWPRPGSAGSPRPSPTTPSRSPTT